LGKKVANLSEIIVHIDITESVNNGEIKNLILCRTIKEEFKLITYAARIAAYKTALRKTSEKLLKLSNSI
jgi:hypothetical protein